MRSLQDPLKRWRRAESQGLETCSRRMRSGRRYRGTLRSARSAAPGFSWRRMRVQELLVKRSTSIAATILWGFDEGPDRSLCILRYRADVFDDARVECAFGVPADGNSRARE